VALFLRKNKDVAFRSDVHVDASGLERIWTIRPEHFDLELGVILANVGHRNSHIEHGFKVALQATLEYSGVVSMPLSIPRPRPPIAM
jgi:S-adenosylhomocysteine hydrolase